MRDGEGAPRNWRDGAWGAETVKEGGVATEPWDCDRHRKTV